MLTPWLAGNRQLAIEARVSYQHQPDFLEIDLFSPRVEPPPFEIKSLTFLINIISNVLKQITEKMNFSASDNFVINIDNSTDKYSIKCMVDFCCI